MGGNPLPLGGGRSPVRKDASSLVFDILLDNCRGYFPDTTGKAPVMPMISVIHKSHIIKTISKGVVLIISPFLKIVIFAGVATCDIIKTSTVDLYFTSYGSDWLEVTQTTVTCLNW